MVTFTYRQPTFDQVFTQEYERTPSGELVEATLEPPFAIESFKWISDISSTTLYAEISGALQREMQAHTKAMIKCTSAIRSHLNAPELDSTFRVPTAASIQTRLDNDLCLITESRYGSLVRYFRALRH